MKVDLTGKRALVGGASKGIGRAIAERLAASGAEVVVMARNESSLQELVAQLDRSQAQNHRYLVVDFSDYKAFSKKVNVFFRDHKIDILINNTQGPPAGSALEKEIEEYQDAFDLLFKCAVLCTTLALPHMQEQHWGRILNVASISVKEPLNYLVLSNTLRAALVTWAKSLSVDIAEDQITINSILTGYFDTQRIEQLNTKKAEKMGLPVSEVRAAMEATVPMKRIGKPEEYANLVCFLASDLAGYITGTTIPIDGGLLKSL